MTTSTLGELMGEININVLPWGTGCARRTVAARPRSYTFKDETKIPLFKPFMPESVIKPVTETLLSGWIGEGPKVKEFEAKLADYLHIDQNA